MHDAIFCWSGGKDSAFALYKVLQAKEYRVVSLFTTVNEAYRRVSMHGVRQELIKKQSESIGIPLDIMYVSEGSNAEYERKMEKYLQQKKAEGVHYAIFGDIFLEDLRAYRDKNLARAGFTGVYPLWKQETNRLSREFIALGFKTVLCCTNDACLGKEYAGEVFTNSLLHKFPVNVDPCGENGEFHSFCFDGPVFTRPVKYGKGEIVYKPLEVKLSEDHPPLPAGHKPARGFWYCDLIPDSVM